MGAMAADRLEMGAAKPPAPDADPLSLRGRKVVVLGLARQGTALARFLAEQGAEVTVSDLQPRAALAGALAALEGLPIRAVLGKHPLSLLGGTDLLCLSGGVPLDAPIVAEAQRRGIPLSNDAQLFLERCPAPVIGITGAAGKTTTAALVYEMCRAAGLRAWLGGNIGNPLITDLEHIGPDDWVVMELSSFQLEIMTVSPHVAAVLNITPNHLDRHKTMEAYAAAKRNIVAHQGRGDFAVLNFDDAQARSFALATAAHLLWFSGGAEVEEGAFKTNGELTLRREGSDRVICTRHEVRLRGRHNLLNFLAACALSSLAGVSVETMRHVGATFAGVEHRLEWVREVGGVAWYDDSIATTPERALAALRSFEQPIVLLAGGRDKHLPWESFTDEVLTRVRQLVTFGEAGPMIAELTRRRLAERRRAGGMDGHQAPGPLRLAQVTEVATLEEAVQAAARLAEPGDVVLLSPGGTSFDAFRDFAERGERFKALVHAL